MTVDVVTSPCPAAGDTSEEPQPASVGLFQVPWVFTSPVRLFRRVEDTGAYGWPLVVLLALSVLIGYAEIQTGLIDRVVALQTERQLAELEKTQGLLVDRMELRDRMDDLRKQGEFMVLIRRLGAVALTPLHLLVSFLFISSILYAAVALTGRKPEYHTLMSICVYAGFVQLSGYALRLIMMLCYRTSQVDTSLAMLAEPGKPTALAAIDPFRIWFWVLVVVGVCVTQQLRRRTAIVWCGLMFLLASAVPVGLSFATPR